MMIVSSGSMTSQALNSCEVGGLGAPRLRRDGERLGWADAYSQPACRGNGGDDKVAAR